MAGLLSGFFGRRGSEPSPEDAAALDAARRPGVVLEVGGKPKPDSRATSWWGGNFIAEPPRPGLVPLVQLRIDEMPPALDVMMGGAYLAVWIAADPARRTGPMLGLEIQRLPAPDPASLAPVEKLCRLDGALACLPLSPALAQPGMMLPHIDDWATPLPHPPATPLPEDEEPVTYRDWPMWIGPSQWPGGDARFVMEIRSSRKGKFSLPDDGSLYIFEDGPGWQVRTDGF